MRGRAVALAFLAASSCAAGTPHGAPTTPATPTTASPSATTASPSATPTTPAPATSKPAPSVFHGSIARVPAGRITSSWHPGCPVDIDDLRLLTLDYWGFDNRAHHGGELVVHAAVAHDVVGVFRTLFEARFPIARMQLVEQWASNDDRVMAANDTSAFNCRLVPGTTRFAQHAYGLAIDIDPVQNPNITSSGDVQPPAGAAYVNRAQTKPGMIHKGDVVWRAFAAIGWVWGGTYIHSKDYQHFSQNGL